MGCGRGAEDSIEKTQKKGITIVGIVWLLSFFFNRHSVSNQVEYRAGQGGTGRDRAGRKKVAKTAGEQQGVGIYVYV